MSQEGRDNRAFISSCSIIEMQRGIEIAGFLVRVCHCLRFTAQCREEGNTGVRGWDKEKKAKGKREGNSGWVLRRKQSESNGVEATFWGLKR